MVTFLFSLLLLFFGYAFYSKFVERVFIIDDNRPTPANTKNDGMDFMPISWIKGSLIQLLNIAGLGPIFGAILGALYGPVAFIWIVIGAIFAGAVHDYFSGMLSVRHNGEQYPSIVGRYLGKPMKVIINLVSIVLMILVAAAFTAGPAELLAEVTSLSFMNALFIIFAYFLLAALLPINKVIGRIYPIFGGVLIFMATAIGIGLLFQDQPIPNLTLDNLHPEEIPIWPLLMVTISCGAISGFHATQSPVIARTLKKESDGRKVFYGAMIGEAVIAMIWAAAAMTFFAGTGGLGEALASGGPAGVVNEISTSMLGVLGGILAILGVIILPITTGDTALRSSRMMLVELLQVVTKKESKGFKMLMAIPVVIPTFYLAQIDYSFLWRYVGWTNQVVATVMLWTGAVYLLKKGRLHWICGLPALFMTAVCGTYIFYAPEGFQLPYQTSVLIGVSITVIVLVWYLRIISKNDKNKEEESDRAA
ncbi:carbon starvation CstA family protein [Desertibacillus haloalkaliphilus]|uniref:carbon starvation CstA family protein n=1 Tax=Desertibacillus haloalkaliphilus TaxID=1328930 RepID=UPI001C25B2E9|nr:carbon starvation CstA family protein [Desertibacillus haloalkaliphilus]MBU8908346.1 carbon starvation protein A [Desertibacillus haloalkaliphilus]